MLSEELVRVCGEMPAPHTLEVVSESFSPLSQLSPPLAPTNSFSPRLSLCFYSYSFSLSFASFSSTLYFFFYPLFKVNTFKSSSLPLCCKYSSEEGQTTAGLVASSLAAFALGQDKFTSQSQTFPQWINRKTSNGET